MNSSVRFVASLLAHFFALSFAPREGPLGHTKTPQDAPRHTKMPQDTPRCPKLLTAARTPPKGRPQNWLRPRDASSWALEAGLVSSKLEAPSSKPTGRLNYFHTQSAAARAARAQNRAPFGESISLSLSLASCSLCVTQPNGRPKLLQLNAGPSSRANNNNAHFSKAHRHTDTQLTTPPSFQMGPPVLLPSIDLLASPRFSFSGGLLLFLRLPTTFGLPFWSFQFWAI